MQRQGLGRTGGWSDYQSGTKDFGLKAYVLWWVGEKVFPFRGLFEDTRRHVPRLYGQ